MDEIYFDNKKFITTKHAAKLANYAKDYVGQLARSGKVEARLIGRNWYISEEALMEHAFGKNSKVVTAPDVVVAGPGAEADPVVTADYVSGVDASGSLAEIVETEGQGHMKDALYEADTYEPIQNNGLKSGGYGTSRSDKAEESLVDHREAHIDQGSPKYWSDDSDLYPNFKLADSGAGSHGDVPSDPYEYIEHDRSTAYAERTSSEVSKITLTLRNRIDVGLQRKPVSAPAGRYVAKVEEWAEQDREGVVGATNIGVLRSYALLALVIIATVALVAFSFLSFTASQGSYKRSASVHIDLV